MEIRHTNSSASLTFLDLSNSLEVIRKPPIARDFASSLINPNVHITSTPAKARITYTAISSAMLNQTVPDSADLERWQQTSQPDKRLCPEFNPDLSYFRPDWQRQNKTSNLRQRSDLSQKLLLPQLSNKVGKRFVGQKQSSVFNDTRSEQLPRSHAGPWQCVDPAQDPELANYAVSSKNAFKSGWMKHSSLKHRYFYPAKHPEFEGFTYEHHKRRDRETLHREAMLKVKAMLSKF